MAVTDAALNLALFVRPGDWIGAGVAIAGVALAWFWPR